jgi:hypothetical protein
MPALQEAGAPDADSITTFGFTNPVPIDETNMILAGTAGWPQRPSPMREWAAPAPEGAADQGYLAITGGARQVRVARGAVSLGNSEGEGR